MPFFSKCSIKTKAILKWIIELVLLCIYIIIFIFLCISWAIFTIVLGSHNHCDPEDHDYFVRRIWDRLIQYIK